MKSRVQPKTSVGGIVRKFFVTFCLALCGPVDGRSAADTVAAFTNTVYLSPEHTLQTYIESSKLFNARDHAAMDSGSTMNVSGKNKFFPKRHVECYNPNTKIEVANGVLLDVTLQGKMLVPCRYRKRLDRHAR